MLRTLFNVMLILLVCGIAACASDHSHSHADGADHEHGPNTHTHDEPTVVADTAGTYTDSTSAFFEGEGHDDDDHEHGPDTHTHDSDSGHN